MRLSTRRSSTGSSMRYVPKHQDRGDSKIDMRNAAARSTVKASHLLKWSGRKLVTELTKSGHLQRLMACPFCKEGKLTKCTHTKDGLPRFRCNKKACQKFALPHANHPVFSTAWGNRYCSLNKQAVALFGIVWGMSVTQVMLLDDGLNRRAVQAVSTRWHKLCATWVMAKQKEIKFGDKDKSLSLAEGQMDEVEADGVVVRKSDVSPVVVAWQIGQARGDRRSLVLDRTPDCRSTRTQTGQAAPPPTSKRQWLGICRRRVGAKTLMHADGAGCYRAPPGCFARRCKSFKISARPTSLRSTKVT